MRDLNITAHGIDRQALAHELTHMEEHIWCSRADGPNWRYRDPGDVLDGPFLALRFYFERMFHRIERSRVARAGQACAVALSFNACDDARRAEPPPDAGVVVITTGSAPDDDAESGSTSDDAEPSSGSSGEAPSTSGAGEASTGAAIPGVEVESTGGDTTAAQPEAGSTGDAGSSSSTGDDTTTGDVENGTSTGDEPPEPSVCGDGVCDDTEAAAGCYTPGWCYADCKAEPECLTECPCEPEANEGKNVCYLAPGTCDATKPGGLCDPDADGGFADGDWILGWQLWSAKCG